MHSLLAVLSSVALSLGLAAQGVAPTRILVVDREDGTPRLGVLVHASVDAAFESHLDPSGRWFMNTEDRVRALRAAVSARSDHRGRVELVLPGDEGGLVLVFAGAPFIGRARPQGHDQDVVLRVAQHEPFSVRVVDGEGAPVPAFAVALHAGGEDVSVALTDDRGVAVLGVPAEHAARLSVAPAGWIGPRDAFPTVATMLRRDRPTLVVPPSGKLRLRAVRAGESLRVPVGTASILQGRKWVSARPGAGERNAFGFEFGPVALGQRLLCTAWMAGRSVRAEVDGPKVSGEIAVFDVDVDPARPRIAFTIAGEAGRLLRGRQPRVAVYTTERSSAGYAKADPAGRFVADFENLLELGDLVLRVEIDEAIFSQKDVPARIWSASVPVGRAFGNEPLDLGEVRLEAFPPLLRGRVVDGEGRALARAAVVVRAAPAYGATETTRTTVYTDADGRFEHMGAIPRDANGLPVQIVATAKFGEHESGSSGSMPIGRDVVLVIRGAAERSPAAKRGAVVARVRGVPGSVADQIRIELVDADGSMAGSSGVLGADGVVRISNLPGGRYTLRLTTPWIGGELLDVADIEVPETGDCVDPRLGTLEVGAALQIAALRVVDPDGVPIAGAHAEMRAGERTLGRETNEAGQVWLAHGRGVAPRVFVEAPGMRPQALDDPHGEVLVTMERAGVMQVRVVGMPADLPRERIRVWVYPSERVGFAFAERAELGDGDLATLPLPAHGRYVVGLYVTLSETPGGMKATRVARSAPFEVGADAPTPVELRLVEQDVARLRAAVRGR